MGKLELEIKILDINKEKIIKKLENLGAKMVYNDMQTLYTYDLPTINGRFNDILYLINNPESKIKYDTSLAKLKNLFFELDNLLTAEDRKELYSICQTKSLQELFNSEHLISIINSDNFKKFISKFKNNNNKWIRLRKSKDKVTITIKHILASNNSGIEQMLENELQVNSIEEGDNFLQSLGYAYKSFQEKERISFKLDNLEIDIDTWPGIPTYLEIEGDSKEILESFIKKIGYQWSDTISCTADKVYEHYGKSMFNNRNLTFQEMEQSNNS